MLLPLDGRGKAYEKPSRARSFRKELAGVHQPVPVPEQESRPLLTLLTQCRTRQV